MSKKRPTKAEALALITKLLVGIDEGFEEADCLPECLWDAYEQARAAIGHPIVVADMPEGLEGRYQLTQDALAGEEWPPEEWVDSGAAP